VPSFTTIVRYLPIVTFAWMVLGAGMIFSSGVGRRDPRGIGIGLSFWALLFLQTRAIPPPPWVTGLGVAGLAASLVLFQWAASSIRGRTFSYAGNDDLPQFVHSAGPYQFIRNPFYASYLLAEIATLAIWPSAWAALVVLGMIGYFQWLTRFEERKFARSPVATEYAVYKARTGRLLPRLRS